MAAIGSGLAFHRPPGSRQGGDERQVFLLRRTRPVEPQRARKMAAIATLAFVNNSDFAPAFGADMCAGPVPALEAVLNRLAAMIAVEIAAAGPCNIGLLHLHLDPRTWGNRLPVVVACRVQFEALFIDHLWVEDDFPLDPTPPRYAQADVAFLDIDDQPVLIPPHRARAYCQAIAFLPRVASAPLGHHPARTFPVERDVQAAMVERNVAP